VQTTSAEEILRCINTIRFAASGHLPLLLPYGYDEQSAQKLIVPETARLKKQQRQPGSAAPLQSIAQQNPAITN
jgi:hypothetical protein